MNHISAANKQAEKNSNFQTVQKHILQNMSNLVTLHFTFRSICQSAVNCWLQVWRSPQVTLYFHFSREDLAFRHIWPQTELATWLAVNDFLLRQYFLKCGYLIYFLVCAMTQDKGKSIKLPGRSRSAESSFCLGLSGSEDRNVPWSRQWQKHKIPHRRVRLRRGFCNVTPTDLQCYNVTVLHC